MSTTIKREVIDLTQDVAHIATKRARFEETPTHVFPQPLKDVEDSLLDQYDVRSDDFFTAFMDALSRADESAILACAHSRDAARCFNALKDAGVCDYSEEALGEAAKEFGLNRVETAFIGAVMGELANDVNEVVASDLAELVEEDEDGLFTDANITEDKIEDLCDSLYYAQCCLWAAKPDWSCLGVDTEEDSDSDSDESEGEE